jgi:hydroxyacyl-ACP dehydratase HTD2-like protein with hotdog domain
MNSEHITFTKEDIDLFAEASYDWNPLHCDYSYSRKSPYGEQVVHGVLGILACMGKLVKENSNITITSLRGKFFKPLFCDNQYNIMLNVLTDASAEIFILDGDTKLLSLQAAFSKNYRLNIRGAPPPPNNRHIENK